MISLNKKIIFIHIPRTAGSSIEEVLNTYSEDTIIKEGSWGLNPSIEMRESIIALNLFDKPRGLAGYYKHLYASQFKHILKNKYDEFYKFTIVRHPIDKLFSMEFFDQSSRANIKNVEQLIDRCKNRIADYNANLNDVKQFKHNRWRMFLSDYIYDNENLIIDDVFRFENLKTDWKDICKKIDIPYKELPYINNKSKKIWFYADKSYSESFTNFLSIENIKFFEDFFHEEIEKLGYEFIT